MKKIREFKIWATEKNERKLLMSFNFFQAYVTKIRHLSNDKVEIKYLDVPHAETIVEQLLCSNFPDIEYENVYCNESDIAIQKLKQGQKILKGDI